MTDITHDLWTVRDALAKAGDRDALAAIGRIGEELARLNEALSQPIKEPEWDYMTETTRRMMQAEAERDDAVAALRLTMRFIAETHLEGRGA